MNQPKSRCKMTHQGKITSQSVMKRARFQRGL
jgi:hypothetical protein